MQAHKGKGAICNGRQYIVEEECTECRNGKMLGVPEADILGQLTLGCNHCGFRVTGCEVDALGL